MADTPITYTKLIDAHTDADTLRDTVNGPPDTKVKARLGREYWTLATINTRTELVVLQANEALRRIEEAKNSAQGALDAAVAEFESTGEVTIQQFQDAITTIVQEDGIPAETVIVGDSRLDVFANDVKNSNIKVIANITELRKEKGNKNGQQIKTASYLEDKNYGGAVYVWDSSSNEIDDGLSVFAVTGVSTGRWKLKIENKLLLATQAGAIADLTEADKVTQTDIIQKCVDYLAKIGGGTLKLPTGHIYAKIIAKANVNIEGTLSPYITDATDVTMSGSRPIVNEVKVTHGTFLHSTGATDTVYIGENIDNIKLSNFELKAIRLDGGLCGYGVRISGKNIAIDSIKGEGFRFDPCYLRGKDDPNNRGGTCSNVVINNCEFGNSARNSFSLVYCNNIRIYNSNFYQTDTSIAWIYLWDIEPNPNTTDTVYDVIVDNCTFNAITRAGAEPTVIVKELNTPNGSPNIKFLNCHFKGSATIRNNCANGWRDAVIDNCIFEGRAFSTTTTGYVIESGRFTNNTMLGLNTQSFAYNTLYTGDFVIEGNSFNNINITAGTLSTVASWGLNYFTGTTPVIEPVDRRSITKQYRDSVVLKVTAPSDQLSAISLTKVRRLELTTTLTNILTVGARSGVKITVAGCDATEGLGSKGYVEFFASSDETTTITSSNPILNDPLYGLNFNWDGKTLQLSAKTESANQWVIRVDVLTSLDSYAKVNWLI